LPPNTRWCAGLWAAHPHADLATLYELVCSDFRLPDAALHIAQAHAAARYHVPLRIPVFDASPIGAAHTTEIPLVFGTLDSPTARPSMARRLQPRRVARNECSRRAFATDGDPGWPAYSADEQLTRVFVRSLAPRAIRSRRRN